MSFDYVCPPGAVGARLRVTEFTPVAPGSLTIWLDALAFVDVALLAAWTVDEAPADFAFTPRDSAGHRTWVRSLLPALYTLTPWPASGPRARVVTLEPAAYLAVPRLGTLLFQGAGPPAILSLAMPLRGEPIPLATPLSEARTLASALHRTLPLAAPLRDRWAGATPLYRTLPLSMPLHPEA
jgi:hypothetical protein